MENQDYFEDRIGLQLLQEKVGAIRKEMAKVIVGQQ
jgi:hypothetical protein